MTIERDGLLLWGFMLWVYPFFRENIALRFEDQTNMRAYRSLREFCAFERIAYTWDYRMIDWIL